MRPLKFKDDVCSEFYKEFVSNFEKRIKKYIDKNPTKKKKKKIGRETKAFLKYLLIRNHLSFLLNCPADKLDKLSCIFFKKFPDFKKKESRLYREVTRIFVNEYENKKEFSKEDFLKALDIKVCPYCNRSYIECIDNNDKKTLIKGQIDHFYSKKEYPFLALSRFNLIPCCSDCNGVGGKFMADADKYKLINPYLLEDTDGIQFKMELFRSHFANFEQCANSIKIKVEEANQSGLKQNIKVFHLQEIYQSHCDIAAEIYLKGKLKMPSTYRQKIVSIMKPIMPITEHDFNQLILGIEDNPQQFKNKSLSKFKADLAKDEMLI